jgi:hypothetical protein
MLIDGVGHNGKYDIQDGIHAIQWTPESYEIEWKEGKNTTCTGAYPHPQHIEEWNRQGAIVEEALIISDEEERLEDEASAERIVKLEALKCKVAKVLTDLSEEELRMLVGLT